MKAGRYVYLNGAVTPLSGARVSVEDRGFLYGDGVFETLKYSNGAVAFKDEHLERLLKNSVLIGIPARSAKSLIANIKAGIIERLIEKNGLAEKNAYVRITVTRGSGGSGLLPSPGISPTCVIVVKAIDAKFIRRIQKNGVKAVTVSGFARALPSIKSLNFLPNVLGKMEAHRRGAYEGLFTGKDGHVTEGTSTNLFIVKKNRILTPPAFNAPDKEEAGSSPSLRSGLRLTRSEGALPGIMREIVIKKAKTLGIPFREASIKKNDLLSCDEAFLTNSIIEAVPLIDVDGRVIGDGKLGDITRMIQMSLFPMRANPL